MCSHLEVLDFSTDAFLNALCCFIPIHGNVSQPHSDQGNNFIGAKGESEELMKVMNKEGLKELL